MTFKYIEYKKRPDKVAELILNRPEKPNAIHDDMRYEMLAALEDAEHDDNINVLILKGNGEAFCAGHDLSKAGGYYGFETGADGPGVPGQRRRRPSQRVRLHRDRAAMSRIYHDRFLFSWVPIIVQLHGYCIGGGMILNLACDITIAAEDAKLGYTEQRMGFAGAAMDLGLLTHAIGPKKAQELLMSGRIISGTEASEIGLVSRAVPRQDLEAEVEKTAEGIARMPRDGIAIARATKEVVYNACGLVADRAIGYMTHTMCTNLRWEPDEFNFFKERLNKGTSKAIGDRNDFYTAPERGTGQS